MNLLETIDKFRDTTDDDLLIQCDVFFDEKLSDEELLAQESQTAEINLDNHCAVFNAIYERVYHVIELSILCLNDAARDFIKSLAMNITSFMKNESVQFS